MPTVASADYGQYGPWVLTLTLLAWIVVQVVQTAIKRSSGPARRGDDDMGLRESLVQVIKDNTQAMTQLAGVVRDQGEIIEKQGAILEKQSAVIERQGDLLMNLTVEIAKANEIARARRGDAGR